MRMMFHESLEVLKGIGFDIKSETGSDNMEELFFKVSTCDDTAFLSMIWPIQSLTGFATVPGSFTTSAFQSMDVLAVWAVGITAEVGMAHIVVCYDLINSTPIRQFYIKNGSFCFIECRFHLPHEDCIIEVH